jgi:hypothetical protein
LISTQNYRPDGKLKIALSRGTIRKFKPNKDLSMTQNIFLPKLLKLAEQQSPTLLEILHRKSLDDGIEDVNDPFYLRNACTILAETYIISIDKGDTTFASESTRNNFLWLLQLLTDIAAGGNMEDLFKTTKQRKNRKNSVKDGLNK